MSSTASDDSAAQSHKWTSFEVRTLICLIIKGEHRASEDPIDLADKLNTALSQPARPAASHYQEGGRGESINTTKKHNYDDDIAVAEVTAMLRRILAKRRHAVDLCERDPSGAVTRRKVRAFARSLDFGGGDDEWLAGGRREIVSAERAVALERLRARNEGRPASSGEVMERERRLEMLESPRAQRLLEEWGMGASFWEGELLRLASSS